MSSPITPLGDRVVAVREAVQDKTASGLYLPDTFAQMIPAQHWPCNSHDD